MKTDCCSYENTNWQDNSKVTDVKHVITDVIECLENDVSNECQTEQQLAENMIIDSNIGEQVSLYIVYSIFKFVYFLRCSRNMTI
jgi:hypothetical protein